jgi:hypothetical protein
MAFHLLPLFCCVRHLAASRFFNDTKSFICRKPVPNVAFTSSGMEVRVFIADSTKGVAVFVVAKAFQ